MDLDGKAAMRRPSKASLPTVFTASSVVLLIFTDFFALCSCTTYQNTNCTLKPHLPCTVEHNTPACQKVENYYDTENWPGPPVDLQVSLFREKWQGRGNNTYPGLNISWRIPPDGSVTRSFFKHASFRVIKGFQVKLIYLSGKHVNKQICRSFNLSEAQWRSEDQFDKLRYNISIYPVTGNVTFYVQLYSLPKPPPVFTNHRYTSVVIKTPNYKENLKRLEPYTWLMYMVVKNDSESKSVNVKFSKAGSEYGFGDYEIMLVKDNVFSQLIQKNIVRSDKDPEVTFTGVQPGRYLIWGSPVNDQELKNDPSRCVCYKPVDGNRRECMDFCAVTKSAVFIITGDSDGTVEQVPSTEPPALSSSSSSSGLIITSRPPDTVTPSSLSDTNKPDNTRSPITGAVKEPVPEPPALDDSRKAGIAVGVIVPLLIGAVILGVYIWKRKVKPEPPTQIINGTQTPPGNNEPPKSQTGIIKLSEKIAQKKKVFILYSNDHPLHCLVVEKLGRFLDNKCACEVIFDLWCTKDIHELSRASWLDRQIENAHKILIVSSEGAYKKYHDKHRNTLMDERTPLGDMYTYGIKRVNGIRTDALVQNSKFIDVYFAYTPKKYRFGDCGQYKLMDHIEDLVFSIHDIPQRNSNTENFLININSKDYIQFEEGIELQSAIKEMTNVTKNPTWFDDFYQIREDQFHDSGVESIRTVSGSVPCVFPPESNIQVTPTSEYIGNSLFGLPTRPEDMPQYFPPVDPDKLHLWICDGEEGEDSNHGNNFRVTSSAPVSPALSSTSVEPSFIPPVLNENYSFEEQMCRLQMINEYEDDWDVDDRQSAGDGQSAGACSQFFYDNRAVNV